LTHSAERVTGRTDFKYALYRDFNESSVNRTSSDFFCYAIILFTFNSLAQNVLHSASYLSETNLSTLIRCYFSIINIILR